VTFEGNPGVLLVLGTGPRGTFDVLIVDPDCGPERGTLLDAAHVAPREPRYPVECLVLGSC
jgi:hypothetical protein